MLQSAPARGRQHIEVLTPVIEVPLQSAPARGRQPYLRTLLLCMCTLQSAPARGRQHLSNNLPGPCPPVAICTREGTATLVTQSLKSPLQVAICTREGTAT